MVTSILENICFASWFCIKENVLWEIMEDTATKMFLMPNFWAPYKKTCVTDSSIMANERRETGQHVPISIVVQFHIPMCRQCVGGPLYTTTSIQNLNYNIKKHFLH